MDPKALYQITYGMYIITSISGDRHNGQTANTVFQISNDPATLAVSINKQNLTHDFIRSGKFFAVSVLEEATPLSLIRHFGFRSGRNMDKFEGIDYSTTENGLRYVAEHSLGYVEAHVVGEADGGVHTIFLGRVTDSEVLKEGIPMTYDHYHRVQRGTAPDTAPIGMKKQSG